MRWITTGIAAKWAGGVGLIAVLMVGVFAVSTPRPTQFATVEAAKQFCTSRGLHWHTGTNAVPTFNSFYVADHPITFNDTLKVAFRSNCGMTPDWKGILWITQLNTSPMQTNFLPYSVGGKYRIWGNVLVAGDEDLMDQIETWFRD
jgi:hypothetical protein